MSEKSLHPYLVVDASVCLKWVLDDEEAIAQAVMLRDDAIVGRFEMIAPSLWLYEVTNGLVTAIRRRRLSAEIGEKALAHMLNLGVRLADPAPEQVYDLSLHCGLAAYDTAYLALAEALDAPLWTGDRRFYEQARTFMSRIQWIGDYRQRDQV